MESFAEYMLAEKDFDKKIEIAYYLKRKRGIFLDNSVLFKATIAKLFIETMNIDVDENLVITAALLCACKKVDDFQDIEKVKKYASESADYLRTLGFSERFCKICRQHNRYSGDLRREKEADILELADQFGGMMLDRPERRGFPIDEAIVLLEFRNLKGLTNRYLSEFKDFINIVKEIPVPCQILEEID